MGSTAAYDQQCIAGLCRPQHTQHLAAAWISQWKVADAAALNNWLALGRGTDGYCEHAAGRELVHSADVPGADHEQELSSS
mmetsp:Transcript_76521/g.212528  ORF Transcript_76521/g.212528 Transcript_76521/m.212528 type:complete len:81 (+) Transcript_76521:241-483(+)